MSSDNQLIVIGNGFDLACNLKSSYSDFFSNRLRVVDSIRFSDSTEWHKEVKENNLTVWDFILSVGIGGTDWCNVEKAIGGWVLPAKKEKEGIEAPIVERFLSMLNPSADSNKSAGILARAAESSRRSESDRRLDDVLKYIQNRTGYQLGQGMDRANLLAFLRIELGNLEKQFRNYLWQECSAVRSYSIEAITLVADMALDGYSRLEDYDKAGTTVLSFNYTMPFASPNRIVDELNVVNIHGKLDDEIIFGVDGKECMDDLSSLPFTKTYRVASHGAKINNRLYDTASGEADVSNTSVIKFFGHSLGEADYSYFQTIFDGVNLYSGSTRLVFYYRPWPGKDEEELHAETVRSVTRLLTTYGGTLDNKDHGKNLMHKLLLEGRLEIKKLEIWH